MLNVNREHKDQRAQALGARLDGSFGLFLSRGERISPTPLRLRRARAFSVLELFVVLVVLGVLILVLAPLPQRGKGHARRTTCASQLANIGFAFGSWASERSNDFPMRVPKAQGGTEEQAASGQAFPNFQVLSNQVARPNIFVCPADNRAPGKYFAGLSNGNISYFVGIDATQKTPLMLLAGDRNLTNGTGLHADRILVLTTNTLFGWTPDLHNLQGNVLLADGSVQQEGSWSLWKLVAQGGPTNRLAMP